MKCEYCSQEIPSGTEFEFEGHYFCNSLHRYCWYSGKKYDGAIFNSQRNLNSDPLNSDDDPGKSGDFIFNKTQPMKLGDIFNLTFNLIRKTFTKNLMVALIFIIPAGLLFSYGMQSYFSNLSHFSNIAKDGNVHDVLSEEALDMMSGMVLYFFSLFIFMLAYMGVLIGITEISCNAMENKRISIKEAVSKIFSFTYLQCIGMGLVILLTIGGAIFAGSSDYYLCPDE